MSTEIDVHGISPLPVGQTIPISYDDSSTRMIAIFFGFICFFLLSAFIMLLWWPMRDAKIRQGDNNTDVESLPSDWSFGQNEGDYNLKLPRAWIETMKRCPDEHFDSRLQQLQKEALETSFESDFSRQHEERQNEAYLSGAGVATSGQWSETLSMQQSTEQGSHCQLTGILTAGERTVTGGKLIEGDGMSRMESSRMESSGMESSRMESSRKVFERTEKTDLCADGEENSLEVRRVKLDDFEGERNEIKKENFLKIYHAYRQYLLVRYDQSKA